MKKHSLILISLIMGSVTIGCNAEDISDELSKEVVRPVKTHTVDEAFDLSVRVFPGVVRAVSTADLSFRVAGPLVSVNVTEGQRVKLGDVIAKIDPRDYRVAVRSARARLTAARAQHKLAKVDFDRIQSLAGQDAVPRARIDDTSARLEVTRAEVVTAERALESAQLAFKDTTLRAPSDGQIAVVQVENHQTVTAGQSVVRMQSSGGWEIVIDVPELVLGELTHMRDKMLDVSFETLQDKTVKAQLKEYETDIDKVTNTYAVTLSIVGESDDIELIPGMSAKVTWSTGRNKKAHIIPIAALGSDSQGQPIVFKINKEFKLEVLSVKLGRLLPKGVEILDGISSGDLIVAAGVRAAAEGMKVRKIRDGDLGNKK